MNTTSLYSLKNLRFAYQLDKQKVEALRGVSLEIARGDFVCLSGPSGSGKSTLLNILGLIEAPQEGALVFDGTNVLDLSESRKNQLRLFKLGYVFQSFNLIPTLTASENVEYFLTRQKVVRHERRKRVNEALRTVGLGDQADKRPMEMSGGQRQRVSIARALAKRPDVIIADEATASLDQKTGREVIETFLRLNADFGISVVIASHDPMVMSLARRNVRMKDGQVVEGMNA